MFQKTNPLILELVTVASALSVIGLFLSLTIDLLALHRDDIIKAFVLVYWSLFAAILVYVVIHHYRTKDR